jgi:hypothetical protein
VKTTKKQTLADLKRRIVVGTKLLCTIHYKPESEGKLRIVTKVQGNGYWFDEVGGFEHAWSSFPKAKDLEWQGLDRFTVKNQGVVVRDRGHRVEKRWTLAIVAGECPHGALQFDGAPGCLDCAEKKGRNGT